MGLRFDDPKGMVDLAEMGRDLADRLSPRRYGRKVGADLRAQAWADLGNAYRVADDLDQAAVAFSHARDCLALGTGLLGQVVQVMELMGSLFSDQRRFREAVSVFEGVAAAHRQLGNKAGLARSLVRLGLVHGYANEPKRAILVLLEALSMIEPENEQRLPAIHGLALNLVEAGLPEKARRVLVANERLYRRRRAGKLNVLRLVWLEGKIAFALGEMGVAEAKLNTARFAFEHVDQSYDAALASLDLALVYARQERRSETVWLVEDLVRAFRSHGIAREAIASLLLLKKACEAGRPADVLLAQIETIAVTVAELQWSRPRQAAR
jgi:tetratricopeptide (TPR) repeat protein